MDNRSCRAATSGAKRLLDVIGAGALAVALLPVMAGVAVAIRICMGNPVFFVQERPGLHGRLFRLHKFRTMTAPARGENALATDARRLTPLGRRLRRLSLDELPQLFDVLSGHMSLVGPRPLLSQYLDRYTPEQARRHEVKPGITGWAQVHGRNTTPWPERLELDVWYVDNWSIGLDLRILAMTMAKVLSRQGISGEGVATMAEFRGGEA